MAITAASLMVKVGADTTPAERALSSFSRSLGSTLDNGVRQANNFSGQFNRAISGITAGFAGGMGFGAVTVGLNSAIGAIQGVIGDAATAYMETERLTMSLKAMSAQELVNAGAASNFTEGLAMASDRAGELLGWIQELAIESPFSSADVAGVMRLGMVYGFNSEQAKRSTAAILDYGAALGLTGPDMDRMVRALGQINQRGKVSTQELNQLSEVGVPGLRILAEAAGISTSEMQKLVEQGMVPAGPAIEALIAKFEEYDGAAAANSGTLGGLLASLEDLKTIGLVDFFGPTFEAAQPKLDALVTAFKDEDFRAGLKETGEQFGAWVGYNLDALSGQVERMSTAMANAPEGEPAWVAALRTVEGLQIDSVAKDFQTIGGVWNALAAGDGELAFSIMYNEQSADVKEMLDWFTWFGAESQREFTALVTVAEGTSDFWTNYGAWFNGEAQREISATVQFVEGASDFWTNYGTWFSGETTREVTAAVKFADDAGAGLTAWWENWKLENEAANASWQPTITAMAEWGDDVWKTLFGQAQTNFAEPVMLSGSWTEGVLSGLWDSLQGNFKEPVMIAGSWMSDALSGLWDAVQGWFNANPVQVSVQTSYTPETQPYGLPANTQLPVDITPPMPEYRIPGGARGFKNFKGGLALVGEEGPELVVLPAGADVIPNDMIPGFAEGTPGAPTPGATFGGLSSSFGNVGDLAVQGAAKAIKDAAKDMTKAMREAIGDLEDAIRSTPGLMGTSRVTADQMRMAEMGVPQSFADDYLRRLSDEVINGVDWANVDIKEAAAAAGIDPNLPAQAILEMFRAAWSDSSLFANPENLKFINTDAVRAQMERQQASEEGKNNIMALFGVGDEELVNQIAGLGIQISSGLQEYLGEQGMGPVGAQAAAGIGTGIAENGGPMGTGLVSGFTNWMTSPDGLSAMASMGDALVANLNAAYKKAAPGYDWSVPAGGEPASTTPPGATPALARGTSWFRGGMALVGEEGPELVRLPMGASVLDAGATAALAPVTVVINATVSQPHDVDLLARKVARVIQQKRGR